MRYLIFLVIWCSFSASAQQIDQKQKTITLFNTIQTDVPREKIYLHFDKSIYLSTDTIWFKAYLVNADLHTPSSISGLIYIDLINDRGNVMQSLSMPTVMGVTWGSFIINSEKYKPGTYTFRAYTNWMQNFDHRQFFKKEINILPISNADLTQKNTLITVSTTTKRSDSTIKQKLRDIDVQFLPEGGTWLANRRQKMAFKALNIDGKGIVIKGEIVDSKQNRIAQFASNDKGMGAFDMHPSENENYTALIKYNGITKTVQLPKAKDNGIALKVENDYLVDSIGITAFSPNANQEFVIAGQARGMLCFVASIKLNGVHTKVFKIPKSAFPTGVCQIIVFDDKNNMLNERNLFINHSNELKLSIGSINASYGTRDSIPIQLNVANQSNEPTKGSFSIAVTDDNQVAKDSLNEQNILSYFLLNSDLKGEIESPAAYFHQYSKQKHDDLEALMLTQGWVSYDWDLTKKPIFKPESEFVISGKVTNILNKPLSKAKIIMMGTNRGLVLVDTVTNENGEFTFDKLPRLDSASFVIQAKNYKGKTGTIGIVMNEFSRPSIPLDFQKKASNMTLELDSVSKNLVATKAEEYKLTFRGGLLLNAVNIIGKRSIKGSKNLNGAGEADQVITEEELNQVSKKTLYDVLVEQVKGFRVGTPRKSTNRTFFIHSNLLKLVIDGVEVDFFYTSDGGPDSYYHYIKSYLDYYAAEDIKGIEIMNSMRYSSNYKTRFMHPMDENQYSFLEITTKTGQGPFLKKSANLYLYKPMNYGDNKIFYSPRYTSQNKADKKPDFRSTIYWNPNVFTNEKGEANISFFSADKPGSYTVWIEGTDLSGNFGFQTLKLKIN